VDFNSLSLAVRERFVSVLTGRAPKPLLAEEATGRNWAYIAVLMFWVTLSIGAFGFASPEGVWHGAGALTAYIICTFLAGLALLGSYRAQLESASYPFPRGRYVFPLSFVDARDRMLRIIPLRELVDFKGVHEHTNGIYTHTAFKFIFQSGGLRVVEAFVINDRQAADDALHQLRNSSRIESQAISTGYLRDLEELDPFVELP
jgi:hypothetical protein